MFHQVLLLLFSNCSHSSTRTIILQGIPIIFASYIQYFTRYSHYYCSVPIISVPNDSSSYFHYFVGCSQYSTHYFVKCSHSDFISCSHCCVKYSHYFCRIFPVFFQVFPLTLSVPTFYKLCTAKRLKSTHALSKFHLLTDSVPHPLPLLDGPNLNPESNYKPAAAAAARLQDMCV